MKFIRLRVFRKNQRVFNFPYHAIDDRFTSCKACIIEQAEILYNRRCRDPNVKLTFSSIWLPSTCQIHHYDFILKPDSCKAWHIPFIIHEKQSSILQKGTMLDVIIKEQEKHWIAEIRFQVD